MSTEIETEIEKIIPIITKAELISRTEALVYDEGLGYAEAIVNICEELSIEPEDIAKLITGPLKNKLEAEAQKNNYLPRSTDLFEFL